MKTYFTQSYSDTNTSAIQTIEINNPYTKSTNVRHIGSYHLRLSDLRTLSLKILILLMVILSFQCINSTNTYAKTKKYTITYKLNKGINSPKNPKKYVKGKKTKLYKPSKSGYTFKGWYKDSKYTKKISSIPGKSKGNITVYAKWEAIVYKITYKTNYGTNHPSNTHKYTVKMSVSLHAPVREYYDFAGWYLDSDFKTKIKKISKGTVGDITLYAKWKHSALNIHDNGSYNMIWSWWYYPNAVTYHSKFDSLLWTFTTNDGYTGIASRNSESGMTTKTYLKFSRSSDDHNGAAVMVMDDGRIMVVYSGGHNTDNEVHVRISDTPGNISSFSTDILLPSSGKTCYGQLLRSNGKYYLFYRVDNTNWAYRYSKDGYKWSGEVMLIMSDIQYYVKAVNTTEDNIVRICMYSNPAKPDCSIRMGFLDTNDNMFYTYKSSVQEDTDNQSVDDIENTNNPLMDNTDSQHDENNNNTTLFDINEIATPMGSSGIFRGDVTVIIPIEKNKMQRMLDVAITAPSDVKILYATFSKSVTNQNCIYKLFDNGNIIDICPGGTGIWKNIYQGGASFIGTDCVVLSREEEGYDNVELYSYSDGQFTLTESVYKEEIGLLNIRNARPIVDVSGNYFLWHRGYYDPLSYKNYLTEAKIYQIYE